MAVAITRTANPNGVNSSSSIATYSSASIGTAATNRIVAVACTSSIGTTAASATIDSGGGAVAMSATANITNGDFSTRIFYLTVASGTAATIRITFTTDVADSQNHIVVYAVTGSSVPLLSSGTDATFNINGDPLTTGSITIPANGGLLGSVAEEGSDLVTWGNATEDTDDTSGGYQYSTAIRATSGTTTITCTSSSESTPAVLAWAVFSESSGQTASAGVAGAGNLSVNAISAQQIQARFAGAGSLYATLVPNTFQFINAMFGGSGNLRASTTQREIIGARFVGAGNLRIDTISVPTARARFVGAGSLNVDTILISAPLPPDLTLHVGEWPVALPECPVLNGFSEQRQRNVVEFQPEVGFTKLHRRATTSVVQTSVTFRMTDAEVDIFNEWYVDYQDDGTLEFTWDHPITKINYSWMFDAQDAPRIERTTPDTFRVSFNLLRLDE